jgi:hypothetical protein
VLGVVLTTTLACGVDARRAGHQGDEQSEFSADRLELNDRDAILDLLEPEEREALTRSQMSGVRAENGDPVVPAETKADKAGKVGLSVLTVALAVGAAAAPFLLF